ncbi:MAG TPA: bacillithiol biosynthesis cysteine-adding enzyme BshC [Puia sp.]|nr:bacillithiol biosynthesis cysteine-adding enzyme BshC [Puia sp.]
MNCTVTHLPYQDTGYFSKIITDYLEQENFLRPFYQHPVSIEGIKSAIHARQQFKTDRKMLVDELKKQYAITGMNPAVSNNLRCLLEDNCFTITTAHQPAIFTGPIYFIYKILHAIKLADYLNKELSDYRFVPVFFMGSEDADLEELGQIYLNHQKLVWDTNQKGAVGRMNPDGLEQMIDRIAGEYSIQPFGAELIRLMKDCYVNSDNIQSATFKLLNAIFAENGLIIVIPDNVNFKKQMVPVFKDDLFNHTPSILAKKAIEGLSSQYEIQANPRDINLFYLKDDIRERIIQHDEMYKVIGTNLEFTRDQLNAELETHPERFSPNVILRGLFQETILPNLAFVGGGGETAYWLELKGIFDHYKVPFPILILRNSFLIVEKKWKEKFKRTGFGIKDIFKQEDELVNDLVRKESRNQLNLDKEIEDANNYYEKLKLISNPVDPTLTQYVEALKSKAVKPIMDLEKKLLKAEKRKFEDQRMHIHSIKSSLFPMDGLQERIENFMPYYAAWGKKFLDMLYKHSPALDQKFTVLEEN